MVRCRLNGRPIAMARRVASTNSTALIKLIRSLSRLARLRAPPQVACGGVGGEGALLSYRIATSVPAGQEPLFSRCINSDKAATRRKFQDWYGKKGEKPDLPLPNYAGLPPFMSVMYGPYWRLTVEFAGPFTHGRVRCRSASQSRAIATRSSVSL